MLAILLWLGASATALAQAPADSKPAEEPLVAAPASIALSADRVAAEALATTALIDSVLDENDPRSTLESVTELLDDLEPVVTSRVASVRSALEAGSYALARDERQQLEGVVRELRELTAMLEAESRSLGGALEVLSRREDIWDATAESAAREKAGPPVRKRIRAALDEVSSAQRELRKRRQDVLALNDQLAQKIASLERVMGELEEALSGGLARMLSDRQAPLPSAAYLSALEADLEPAGFDRLHRRVEIVRDYCREKSQLLLSELVLLLFLASLFHAVRARARRRASESLALREAERVWEHPWAMAVVLTAIAHYLANDLSPQILRTLNSTVLGLASLWLVRSITERKQQGLLLSLLALLLVDGARSVVEPLPAIARLLLLIELAGSLVLVLSLSRGSRLSRLSPSQAGEARFRALGVAIRIAGVGVGVALLAGIAGWDGFSLTLGGGLVRSALVALILYAGAQVVNSVVAFALVARPLRDLYMVRRHGALVLGRLQRAVEWGFTLWWASLTLEGFTLRSGLFEVMTRVFEAGVSVGELTLSLGGILVFALTFYLASLAARLLTFVLEEDVFPRVRLARGVPYALSSLSRYAVLFLGFLFALAAGGFSLDRVAILVGGLGVGIGFGLQNVINNFVSGLILLFERPVQVGDSVQLQEASLFGEVKRIGIRASVIRTWDGAEVVVPNGVLISSAFTNWTLSDRRRRLDIPFGVAYGTDPSRVIDLIVGAAEQVENVLHDPAPQVHFQAFGDSSLDFILRAWIPDFDVGLSTRSRLVVTINDTLEANGIEIPFPQRALHLRSVDANVREAPPAGSGGGDSSV